MIVDTRHEQWETRLHVASARALYLHLPFCVRKCAYCDFASRATGRDDPAMAAYVSDLLSQVRRACELGLLEGCQTAYLGGGTPTYVGAELLGQLVSALRKDLPQLQELTVEANPDSLGDDVLRTLAGAGATRLSIGVQSLDDAELVALGRVHDARAAWGRVAAAVAGGFDVSVDLMCATPGQTDESWRQTLGGALALGAGHVSVYPLQIEEGTPLAQALGDEEPAWNAPEVQAARMEEAERLLGALGYQRYEVASYALPGKDCRHNQTYWTGQPYLGIGAGAASMLTREAYELWREGPAALPAPPDDVSRVRMSRGLDGTCELEFLSEAQAAAEDLMLGMRMSAGVAPGLLGHARSVLGEGRVDEALEKVVLCGLAAWEQGRLRPTHEGWLLGNELYGELWGLASGEVRCLTIALS